MLASNPTHSGIAAARKTDYNSLLISGYTSFQNKELTKSLAYYQDALDMKPDATSAALVHSIIGVLHMHGCNYSEAINSFSEGLKLVEANGRDRQSSSNYEQLSVMVKLHANLSLCYLVIGQHKQAVDLVVRCLSLIRTAHQNIRTDLFHSLMYIFFRFTSFSALKTLDTDSPESKYDDVTQGCFYSTMAVNKDLCSTPDQAYRFQRKALDIWNAKKEYGLMLISQRHLLHLAKELDKKKDIVEYQRQIQRTLESEQLQGISQKTLFKGYQQKMKTAKDITTMLSDFERTEKMTAAPQQILGWKQATRLKLLQAINSSKRMMAEGSCKNRAELERGIQQMYQTIKSLESQRNVLVQRNLQKSKFVVDAVNYLKAQSHRIIKMCENKRKNDLEEGFSQLKKWNQAMIQYECQQQESQRSQRHPSGINPRVQQQPYPRGNTNNSFSTVDPRNGIGLNSFNSNSNSRIDRHYATNGHIQHQHQEDRFPVVPPPPSVYRNDPRGRMEPEVAPIAAGRPFQPQQSVSPLRTVERPVSPALTSRTNYNDRSFYYCKDGDTDKKILRCIRKCESGQYLLKRHFTSDGGDQKFVKLTKIDIRWASDEEKIMKPGKNQAYLLTDVKGIIYGKVTQTMRKGCNKDLVPWKCFSLVLKKRTLDMYCPQEEDVDYWVPGLSGALARANPEKHMVGYSPGKMLWTKMFLILNHHFIESRGKYERHHAIPFVTALLRFQQNGCRLPPKKK